MTLNAAQNFERQLVRAPPKESQDRSCRKLTRFRHAPFHTCYLYPVHLWPGSSVNWGPTFRKHRKYDINTPRLCPRDARDLSLAHFPASIYPGKTSPSRLQEGLPPPPLPPRLLPPCRHTRCIYHKTRKSHLREAQRQCHVPLKVGQQTLITVDTELVFFFPIRIHSGGILMQNRTWNHDCCHGQNEKKGWKWR